MSFDNISSMQMRPSCSFQVGGGFSICDGDHGDHGDHGDVSDGDDGGDGTGNYSLKH